MNLSYEDYKQLTEQSPILIWRAALDKKCDYFNERWMSFTGRKIEDELGDGWATGVHLDDLDRCIQIYTTSFDNRQVFEMEYRLKRYDGQYRWLLDRGVPRYENGNFVGYIGSCIDIHEKVIARQHLEKVQKEQDEQLHELQELLPICSICKNIRDDSGYWQKVETHIQKLSTKTNFTHSLCPVCIKKYFDKKKGS